MDPNKEPPGRPGRHFWNKVRSNKRSLIDRGTQYVPSTPSSSHLDRATPGPSSLQPSVSQVTVARENETQPVRIVPQGKPGGSILNDVNVLTAPKLARPSPTPTGESSHDDDLRPKMPSMSTVVQQVLHKPVPATSSKPNRSTNPAASSKKRPKATEELMKPRDLKNMAKFSPLDDDELIAREVSLMSWASRLHVPLTSISTTSLMKKLTTTPSADHTLKMKPSGLGLNELEISRKPRGQLEEGVQEADTLFDDTCLRHNLFADVDAYKQDATYAPYGFLIICGFQIFWGLLALTQAFIILFYKSQSEEFFAFDKKIQKLPLYLLISSAIYSVIIGVFGIFALLKDIPLLYSLISKTSWLIFAMSFGASLIAIGSWSAPTDSTYYRIWESALLKNEFPAHFKKVFPDLNYNVIEKMQSEIKCCGMGNASEWLHTPKQIIPVSCCADKSTVSLRALASWNAAMKQKPVEDKLKHLHEIRRYLYLDSCLVALEAERKNLIRDYSLYPIIYLAFYFVIMMKFDYLSHVVQREYSSWEGITRMYSFRVTDTTLYKIKLRHAFCSLIPFCGRKKSVKEDVKEFEDKLKRSKELRLSRMSEFQQQVTKMEAREAEPDDVAKIGEDAGKVKVPLALDESPGNDKLSSDNPRKPVSHWSYKAKR